MIFPRDAYNSWHINEVTVRRLLPTCEEGAKWGYQKGMTTRLRVQKDEIEKAVKDLQVAFRMILDDEEYNLSTDDKAQAIRAMNYADSILAKYALP